jgi:hypothetical protein
MTAEAQVQTDTAYLPALVIFGLDDSKKPHAASFCEGDVALATKAASLMGMRLLPVLSDDARALAFKVPKGKVFGSGKAFTPFIKADLYTKIEAIAPASDAAALEIQTPVQARELVEETDDRAITGAAALLTTNWAPVPQPTGWHDIQVGSIVLSAAQPGVMDFFECLVLSAEGEDRYKLRYCDWPQEPTFTHHVIDIGLLHPSRQPEPPLEADQPSSAA